MIYPARQATAHVNTSTLMANQGPRDCLAINRADGRSIDPRLRPLGGQVRGDDRRRRGILQKITGALIGMSVIDFQFALEFACNKLTAASNC